MLYKSYVDGAKAAAYGKDVMVYQYFVNMAEQDSFESTIRGTGKQPDPSQVIHDKKYTKPPMSKGNSLFIYFLSVNF